MAFMNKADTLALAESLGIENAAEMKWNDLQAAIAEAQKDGLEVKVDSEQVNNPRPLAEEILPLADSAPEQSKQVKKIRRPIHDNGTPLTDAELALSSYAGTTIFLSPELLPERYRLLKYEENLGPDVNIVERQFGVNEDGRVFDQTGEFRYDHQGGPGTEYTSGTYRIAGESKRQVKGIASVPKENAGMTIRPWVDEVPVVSWKGRIGYLYSHPFYPNVKQLLKESGYYQKYKDRFIGEPNVWYAAGQLLVCDPILAKSVFREIEEDAQKRIEETKAKRRALGLED